MNKKFEHKNFEKKWQDIWANDGNNIARESSKPKTYVLDMFPYPSGEGLHVGHPKGYIATDIYSRFKRMTGHEVLHPMGWDAFGLPAENFAIKNKIHPKIAIDSNINNFKKQLKRIGFDYDWGREINTTDPNYYKWTQWIFIQLFKNGLAYESYEPINWCNSCQTGLANEDLESDGTCERCGSFVEKLPMRQWVLKIREYADRMITDLDELDWPEHIKEAQKNWIGKTSGLKINFRLSDKSTLAVFTTRPETLYGVTAIVIAPEHILIKKVINKTKNNSDLENYIQSTLSKKETERLDNSKERTGIKLDEITAINPVNGEEIPIFVSDYILNSYGTGAVTVVPAHDKQDYFFANRFNLPHKLVLVTDNDGVEKLVNSDEFTNFSTKEARLAIRNKVDGKEFDTYKIKDWVFSRQRYWGEPIPIIHCIKCGAVPVPENQLPVVLPEVEHYEPTGTGESPLANINDWVNTPCPKCGESGKRETNTMPQWAGSSWYYLRFMDPKNQDELVSKNNEAYWSPVDVYVGGDHAVRHLIYARFWHKFLYDIGVVSTLEPFKRLEFLGFILAEDGRKMSKRWGNVINPDDIIEKVGADTLRIYEMFMGPFENTISWSTKGLVGSKRFLERVNGLSDNLVDTELEEITINLNQTIKKVQDDIEAFKFNTAISSMMIFVNLAEKHGLTKESYYTLLKLLAPFAPHLTEEIWNVNGNKSSIHKETFPKFRQDIVSVNNITLPVQINGKVRGSISVSIKLMESEVIEKAKRDPMLAKWINGSNITKTIFVPGRILNLIIK